jgi:hypothetical protein
MTLTLHYVATSIFPSELRTSQGTSSVWLVWLGWRLDLTWLIHVCLQVVVVVVEGFRNTKCDFRAGTAARFDEGNSTARRHVRKQLVNSQHRRLPLAFESHFVNSVDLYQRNCQSPISFDSIDIFPKEIEIIYSTHYRRPKAKYNPWSCQHGRANARLGFFILS